MKLTFTELSCSVKTRQRLIRIAMRVGVTTYFILVLTLDLLLAHTGKSQGIDKVFVTIEMKNESLSSLFKKIQDQTGFFFTYQEDQVKDYPNISMPEDERSVEETLRLALDGTGLRFTQVERYVLISKRGKEDEAIVNDTTNDKVEVEKFGYTVSGTVKDGSSQEPLAGVNIIVKGTINGTTTDVNGKFAIADVNDGDILVFSFIGFRPFETQLSGAVTILDIIMESDVTALQEVVVNAGYYNVKDREQTGNIAKITSKDIAKQPVQNPLQALQGRVPGLEVTQISGVPGGNFKIRIRGTNSIASGNDPLFIIDGVPFTSTSMTDVATSGQILRGGSSPFNSLNPSDIESIEVLKDADATAIYGSRGSNGVILITTKKGYAGKTKIDLNFYSGAGTVARKMDMLNVNQYLEMRREAFTNDGVVPTTANGRDLMLWDTTRYTDWQKELLGGTAKTNDLQLSLAGGDKNTQFSIGGGFHNETTVFPGDNSDRRFSILSSVTNSSFQQKLKTTISINYVANSTDLLRQDLTSKALMLPPIAPRLLTEEGDLNWDGWTSSFENPIAYTKRKYEATTNNLRGNLLVGYSILPNLDIRSSFGYTNVSTKAITLNPISSQFPDPGGTMNRSEFWDRSFKNWIVEPQIHWRPKLGQGQFDVLIGTSFLDQVEQGQAQGGVGFSSEALMKNASSASLIAQGTNLYSQYRYHAIFGRINYNYRGKYIINITGRRDGSSRFGPGKQFATFGAFGVAWIFSEESFIKNSVSFLSFGKIRMSYGSSGNDQLGNYQYLDTYSSSTGQYLGRIGLGPDRLSNPDFAWEENKKFETGLELGFFNDRVFTRFSYFNNKSSSQLVGFPLPLTTGFSSIQGNFPATVQNTGVEIELTTENVKRESFSWTTSFNMTLPRNKLVEFPNIEAFPAYDAIYKVGEPLSSRKLYTYKGIDPITGVYAFEDVNSNGSMNYLDANKVMFKGQRIFSGLNNAIQYKGFQLDVFIQFVKQEAESYMWYYPTPGTLSNQPTLVMKRWQNEGDDTDIQKFSAVGGGLSAYENMQYGELSITDASFIRLKNVNLSYTLPLAAIARVRMQNARVFIQAQNLFTVTDYLGLDPETGSSALSPLRIITGGIHLTF